MITTVTGQMNQSDNTPALEFFEAGADVGAGHFKDCLNLLGIERLG